jgi:protein-tyrosine phosphatase
MKSVSKLKTKILFVCLGNICRSPLAEAIFLRHLKIAGMEDKFSADSCGTSGHHAGDNPDSRTIRNARKNGIEIQHIGRQFSLQDFSSADMIVAMDKKNFNNIQSLAFQNGFHKADIRMMRSFDPEAQFEADVPDPWYGGEEGFEDVFQILWRSCGRLAAELVKTVPVHSIEKP